MSFIPPTPNTERRMKEQLFKEQAAVAQDVRHLREWLSKQPHLPHVDDFFLERFLYSCKYSLPRVKTVLDMYYTVRGAVHEMFKDRDPAGEGIRQNCKVSLITTLPRLTPAGYRVFFHRLADPDVQKYDILTHFKRTFMVVDALLRAENVLGAIVIMDLKDSTLGHLVKTPMLLLRKISFCFQDACPIRIKEFHVVNAPVFASKLMEIINPILKEKLRERFHVHSTGLENVCKSVPVHMLPGDYGGNEKSLKELSDAMQQTLESQRDWFRTEELKVADESKRPGKSVNQGELFGLEGSFRKLTID